MRASEFFLRVVRRIGPLNALSQPCIRYMVGNEKHRNSLNRYVNELSDDERAVFQNLSAKAFTSGERSIGDDAVWESAFNEKTVKMPLRTGSMWLDWDNAISIIGHDLEVKRTYERLIRSEYRPNIFFDVGANYGTHSLLFLIQGIRAVSFEPNPECQKEFTGLCELNGVSPEIVSTAVGDRNGNVEFVFPKQKTWLGTMVDSTKDSLLEEHDVERLNVNLIKLDDFVAENKVIPDLIKIDTEGNELNVIKGAESTIRSTQPLIIFEANNLSDRDQLWKVFADLRYAVCDLPFDLMSENVPISVKDFQNHTGFNFIALPKAHDRVKK
jgi:FkbM family methyltransferase